MVQSMDNTLHELDPHTLRQWILEDKACLIDVREAHEFSVNRIPGSTLIPTSAFCAKRLPSCGDQVYVFLCKAGVRSVKCADIYMSESGVHESYHLGGGVDAWIAEDCPIEMSMMQEQRLQRMVNGVLGVTLILSVLLSTFLHLAFLAVPLVLAAFMVHAAWSGTDLIEWFLSRFLPENDPRMH